MTEQIEGQMSFLPPEEEERLRRWYMLKNLDGWKKIDASEIQAMPDGSEVIVVVPGHDYTTGALRMDKNKYYRTAVEHVMLRYGPDVHLVSDPSGEWPERPPWQSWRDRKQWTTPSFGNYYFTRNE